MKRPKKQRQHSETQRENSSVGTFTRNAFTHCSIAIRFYDMVDAREAEARAAGLMRSVLVETREGANDLSSRFLGPGDPESIERYLSSLRLLAGS